MDQEQHPYEDLWAETPAPAAPAVRGRRIPRFAVAAGLTTFFALGGAGVAFAVSGGSSATPSAASGTSSTTTPSSVPGHGGHGGGRFGGPGFGRGPGMLGGFGLGGAVVHGQETVKQGTGYKTVYFQTGTVKAVSGSSITVVSSDNYEATYTVKSSTLVDSQAGGISAVAVKDTVSIEAVDGTPPVAASILDTTKVGASRQGFGFGDGDHGGMPGGAGGSSSGSTAPSSTASQTN